MSSEENVFAELAAEQEQEDVASILYELDEPTPKPKTERKVVAGASGAVVGVATADMINWTLETYAFSGDLPTEIGNFVTYVVPGVLAFIAAWWVKHTFRPDLEASGLAAE